MNISLLGHKRDMAIAEASGLPSVGGTPSLRAPRQEGQNLTVSEAQSLPAGDIPPVELELALVRDDAMGVLADRAFATVRTQAAERAVEDILRGL